MATTKPRVTVTLEQADYDLLAEFADQQGCSMSSVLVEVWQEAAPTITRVVKLIKEAKAAQGQVGDRIREMAIEAELQMMPLAREAINQLDIFEDEVRKAITTKPRSEGSPDGGAPATATGERSRPRKGRKAP